MAKSNKPSLKKASPVMEKGKVTPIKIAFIVERFLADNNYPTTLATFRSEASDLFSKAKAKEVPKGLPGLGEILDEYISLKEQRIMVDQEKRRVEIAFQGLSDVMRAFSSPQSPTLLQQNPNGGSPPQAEETNKFASLVPKCSSVGKRTASSSAPKAPLPSKRYRAGSIKDLGMIEDAISTGRASQTNNTQDNNNQELVKEINRVYLEVEERGKTMDLKFIDEAPDTWDHLLSKMAAAGNASYKNVDVKAFLLKTKVMVSQGYRGVLLLPFGVLYA